jgi:hypothetical protein
MAEYRTTVQNAHARDEYLQWARILSQANPVHGMLLVFVQKLCTAFHEFAPAWQEGALSEQALPFIRQRLSARTRTVLDALVDNDLGTADVAADLGRLLASIEAAGSMKEIADLSEQVHVLGHAVCDWLEEAA